MDDNNFPDWDNWSNLITDVHSHFKCKEKNQLVNWITDKTTFLFNKAQFRNFVNIIPYMVFDNYFVCPCSRLIEHIYITSFKIARRINYFTCDSTIIFKDISELLSHLKPLVEYSVVSDSINRYHQALYFW